MSDRIVDRIARQHAEDMTRLADQAARNGVRILATRDGAHFATNDPDPTRLHVVTPDGCDCNRFRWFGRCQHHALLLAELGLIEDAGHAHIAEMADDAWQELVDAGVLMPPADHDDDTDIGEMPPVWHEAGTGRDVIAAIMGARLRD